MSTDGESKLPKRKSLLPGIQKSPGISKPNSTSLTQTVPANAPIKKLEIGERVSISGVKYGTLKYYGEIPLASGIWCGIELDEADGKHDGEVDGRRYFTCEPQHGIFAPIDKVEAVQFVQLSTEKDYPVISKESPVHQQDSGKKTQFDEASITKKRCLPQLSSRSAISSHLPSAIIFNKNEQKQIPTKFSAPKHEVGESNIDLQHGSQVTKISSIVTSAIKPVIQATLQSQDAVSKYKQEFLEHATDSSYTDASRPDAVRRIPKASNLPGASRLPKYGKTDSRTLHKAATSTSDTSSQHNQPAMSQPSSDKTFNTTFNVDNDESNGGDGFSDGVKLQLRADSRQYLNLTFDADNGMPSFYSLPDVVSSASPSPETRKKNEQNYIFDTCASETSSLLDTAILDNTDLLDNTDVKQLGDMNYRPVKETNTSQTGKLLASYPGEVITSTPLAQEKINVNSDSCDSVGHRHGSGGRVPILPNPGIREMFSKLPGAAMQNQTQICSNDEVENNLYGDDDNILTSKENQTFYIEDDSVYNTTGNSANVDISVPVDGLLVDKTFVVEKGITEISMPLEEMELLESLGKEELIEDFLGAITESFVQDLEQVLDTKCMTDSGISARSMTESAISDKLCVSSTGLSKQGMETVTVSTSENIKSMTDSGIAKSMTESGLLEAMPVMHSKKKAMVDSGISDECMSSSQQIDFEEQRLESDLKAGHVRQERPVSLISATSADTGYFPDTDSEIGTLTANSPSDWMEKQSVGLSISDKKNKELMAVQTVEPETRSDFYSDAGTLLNTDSETDSDDAEEVAGVCITASDLSGIGLLQDDFESADAFKTMVMDKSGSKDQEKDNFLKSSTDQSETSETASETTTPSVSNGDSVIEREVIPLSSHSDIHSSHSDVNSSQSEIAGEVSKINSSKPSELLPSKPNLNVGYVELVHESSKEKHSEHRKSSVKKKPMEKVEHKKINVSKVRSSLADYINSPIPVKHSDEKENETKAKKNMLNKKWGDNKKVSTAKSLEKVNGNESDKKENSENKHNRIIVEKEIPKIKKSTPKSKWGNIMSKIEANKEVPYKPKPKSEIKSKLDIFSVSNTSTPNIVKKEKELKKPRSKLVQVQKPDFSKVKSKLNITAPPSVKRDQSPADVKKTSSSKSGKRQSNGNLHVDLSESLNSAQSSARTSHTDLSGNVSDSQSLSPGRSKSHTPRNSLSRVSNLKSEHPSSAGSSRSDISQVSVKVQNEKNIKKSEMPRADKSKRFSDVKSSIPPPDRNRAVRSTKSTYLKSSHQPDLVSNSLQPSSNEISRLESLCESRTKELNYVKMQLKSNTQAFDAMSCLVRYLTEELDAFSGPLLLEKLKTLEAELVDAQSHIGEVEQHKERLDKDLDDLRRRHQEELESQKQSLETRHTETVRQVHVHHDQVIACIKECHSETVSDQRIDHQRALDSMRLSHLEEIETLRTKHDHQMEELHKQHRSKVDDMTNRFESIKLALGEKVEMMKMECEENRRRAKASEEALLRDSDVRVHLALQPYQNLPKEIESLKTVVEMRNEEIQKLRLKNMDLEKHLEELPIVQEKLISCQQKIENLEAIVNIKTDHEKQLHGKCQNLMKKYDKESKTNKRLSMDYEELMWRMIQESSTSSDNVYHRQISHSPPSSGKSSPDPVRKGLTSTAGDAEATLRRCYGDDSFERRLKRRSGTFIIESKGSSPSAIPQAKRSSSEGVEPCSPQSSAVSCSDTSKHSVTELSSLDTSLQRSSEGLEPCSPQSSAVSCSDTSKHSVTELSSLDTSLQSVSSSELSTSNTSDQSVSQQILSLDTAEQPDLQAIGGDCVFEDEKNDDAEKNVSVNVCVALPDEGKCQTTDEEEQSLPQSDEELSPPHSDALFSSHDGGHSSSNNGEPSLPRDRGLSAQTDEKQSAQTDEKQSAQTDEKQSAQMAHTDEKQSAQTAQTDEKQSAQTDEKQSAQTDEKQTAQTDEKQSAQTDEKQSAQTDEKQSAQMAHTDEKQSAQTDEKQSAQTDEKQTAQTDEKQTAQTDEKQSAKTDDKQTAQTDEKQSAQTDEKQTAQTDEKQSAQTDEKQSAQSTQTDEKQSAQTDEKQSAQSTQTDEKQSEQTDEKQTAQTDEKQSAQTDEKQSAQTDEKLSAHHRVVKESDV
ncbi:uncharacterized protein LOC121374428 [Gigantopelta aegis]|uniref:uncharacterized protein LOC121374428 n=1 Tax=Gigantopelta aegis TaxID=1735272 RepID=UPI001B88BBC7|nr:uncharacterized protein LOC121374428 [Gigantopelta aegis]